jgi:hypothetical protein
MRLLDGESVSSVAQESEIKIQKQRPATRHARGQNTLAEPANNKSKTKWPWMNTTTAVPVMLICGRTPTK